MKPAKNPLVSLIITTRNSGLTLQKLLQSITQQSYKQIEIIVIDNNSTDETLKIAKLFTNNIFLKGPERSAQRNLGARFAKGKYLLFLDSDMILSPQIVKECVHELEYGGRFQALIIPEKSFGQGFWAKTKSFERELNRNENYFEAARFFPKKIFDEIGGYDENLTGPEDWDLPERISQKNKIGRIRSLILHNEGRPTLYQLAKRKFYYGLSAHQYFKKQNLFPLNIKTVYLIRPAFYRQWRKIFDHPILSLGMLMMLIAETFGGGLGYLVGRFKDGK